MNYDLHEVVPWGRTRREYELMFRLDDDDLVKTILGCGDGPASFNAEMSAEGHSVTSVDPIYQHSALEIRRRFDEIAEQMIKPVREQPEQWTWTCHRDADDLLRHRCQAISHFETDFEAGRSSGRYITASLPELPFAEGYFELAVCSHLLFLYSDLLNAEFHERSVVELCRVAEEVRIFPLLTLRQEMSPHLPAVQDRLEREGFHSRVEVTEYELQRGGNQMLRVWRSR